MDDRLNYIERPEKILDREMRNLKNKVVGLVKVQLKHHKQHGVDLGVGSEMREYYLKLFGTTDFEDEVRFKWGKNCNT